MAHYIHATGTAAGGKAVTLADAVPTVGTQPADKSALGAHQLIPKRPSLCPTSNLRINPTYGCLKTGMRPVLTFVTATETTWTPCLSTGKMAWSLHSPYGVRLKQYAGRFTSVEKTALPLTITTTTYKWVAYTDFPQQEAARPMICGGWMTALGARVREAAPDVILAMHGSLGVSLTCGRVTFG